MLKIWGMNLNFFPVILHHLNKLDEDDEDVEEFFVKRGELPF